MKRKPLCRCAEKDISGRPTFAAHGGATRFDHRIGSRESMCMNATAEAPRTADTTLSRL
ncbi:MAG: hypothetical protein ABSF69_22105 [Polyangiaceae bacterium]|jgi:hypothetical protein